ncbi:acyltransferase family protein [Pseudoduganella chitinolytica]|uniref:Acyltransferase n=1 Tax=Pseudoduganella chitinolytica TaxID=34070 RepID=A0ABY8BFN3_9BURK|nr:acyltransferase [Pseudoduganella chitinolytica]WEF33099.1 acyltransferase [Pseudoduganella chitinolytica]
MSATREPGSQPQLGLINLLKAGAAQLIVLHHLAFYGPMADRVRPLLPDPIDWLADTARIAVQVFLVIGGFLAAKSLAPSEQPGMPHPLAAIGRRYAKLAPPFIAATLLTAVASDWASGWMTHDSISPPPTLAQLGAHALLLHGVLGFDSVAAGAWYVAIDFQLYALLVAMLWLGGAIAAGRPTRWLMPAAVALGVAVSLLHFNLDADWDIWALYFFGSYGLGVLAWWASDRRHRPGFMLALLVMMLVPAVIALALDFRSRIALAVLTAGLLVLFGRSTTDSTGRFWTTVNTLGRISYSMFLVHFAVCLLVNAAFTRFVSPEAEPQAFGMAVAWAASLAAGAAFHRWVEVPLGAAVHFITRLVARPLAGQGERMISVQ